MKSEAIIRQAVVTSLTEKGFFGTLDAEALEEQQDRLNGQIKVWLHTPSVKAFHTAKLGPTGGTTFHSVLVKQPVEVVQPAPVAEEGEAPITLASVEGANPKSTEEVAEPAVEQLSKEAPPAPKPATNPPAPTKKVGKGNAKAQSEKPAAKSTKSNKKH